MRGRCDQQKPEKTRQAHTERVEQNRAESYSGDEGMAEKRQRDGREEKEEGSGKKGDGPL